MPRPSVLTVLDRALEELPRLGIHTYSNRSVMEANQSHMSSGRPFRNFQWVSLNRIARCAQPGYEGRDDTAHTLHQAQLHYLSLYDAKRVISLNHCYMDKFSVERLRSHGIAFQHIKIEDYQSLNQQHLLSICDNIQATAGATLIYCGYGQGRTGTAVAGWAVQHILRHRPRFFVDFSWVTLGFFLQEAFGVEANDQYRAIGTFIKSLAAPPPTRRRLVPPSYVRGLGAVPTADVWTKYLIAHDASVFLNATLQAHPNILANGAAHTDTVVHAKLQQTIAANTQYDLQNAGQPTMQPGIAPGNAAVLAAPTGLAPPPINNGGQANFWDAMSGYDSDETWSLY